MVSRCSYMRCLLLRTSIFKPEALQLILYIDLGFRTALRGSRGRRLVPSSKLELLYKYRGPSHFDSH